MQIDRNSVRAVFSVRIAIRERPQLQNKHCKHSITPTEMHQVHLLAARMFAKHVCMLAELVCMFDGLVCMFTELVCMSGDIHAPETRSDSEICEGGYGGWSRYPKSICV